MSELEDAKRHIGLLLELFEPNAQALIESADFDTAEKIRGTISDANDFVGGKRVNINRHGERTPEEGLIAAMKQQGLR